MFFEPIEFPLWHFVDCSAHRAKSLVRWHSASWLAAQRVAFVLTSCVPCTYRLSNRSCSSQSWRPSSHAPQWTQSHPSTSETSITRKRHVSVSPKSVFYTIHIYISSPTKHATSSAHPPHHFYHLLCFRHHWETVPEAYCIRVCPSVRECMSESVRPENFVNTISHKLMKGIWPNFGHRCIWVHRCAD